MFYLLSHFLTCSPEVSSAILVLILGVLAPVVITAVSMVEIVSPSHKVAGSRLRRRIQATRFDSLTFWGKKN